MARQNSGELYKDTNSNIYYNIRIQNNEPTFIPANFKSTRVQNIVDNPSDYELAVVRFSVPSYNIPVYFFEENTLTMSLSVVINGIDFSETVSLNYIQKQTPELYGRPAIWNYNTMIAMLNDAMERVLNDIYQTVVDAGENLPVGGDVPPFFVFTPETRLIEYLVPTNWINENGTPAINWTCSTAVQRLFPTFNFIYDGETIDDDYAYEFLTEDRKFNRVVFQTLDYYRMVQDTPTLYLWSPLRTILFKTQSIPVSPEFLPTINNAVSRIITDFQAPLDDPSRAPIQFYPQGPLRFYDLKSNYGLRDIDLIVEWVDWEGVSYPIYLTSGDLLTCKLLFRKKARLALDNLVGRSD